MNSMNLIPAYAEITLVISTLAILLIDMFLPQNKRFITFLLSIFAVSVCAFISYGLLLDGKTVYTFNNMFVGDALANVLKLFSYLGMILTLIYSRQYIDDRDMTGGHLGGEFYVLALFSLLGQMVIISGSNFLILYLGIELMSLPLYALVALRRDNKTAAEAAMKYFILGALGSGFLLYGISMLYGATGSLDLQEVSRILATGEIDKTVLILATVFLASGIAFKLGVVPFHMWVPDVYQGAPTAVALLIGGIPKLAAFAICFRMLVQGLTPLAIDWQQMLMVMAVLSMAIGNITALMQTNIKRMLGYSTIAQMGFMLLGFLSGFIHGNYQVDAVNAYSSSLFYTVTYVLTALGAFGVILILSSAGFEAEKLEDFRGLSQRNPMLAFMMMLFMLSLAGLPPLVGFYAKLSVLQAVLATGQTWLAILAILFSLLGAYYYLRVIKLMYFDKPVRTDKIVISNGMWVTISFNGMAVLLLGILPGALLRLCMNALSHSL